MAEVTDIETGIPDNSDTPLNTTSASEGSNSPRESPLMRSGKKELPPHWERVKSEQHGRYYYWNRESGKTTWRFPEEEAMEHQKLVMAHKYVNIAVTPNMSPAKPPSIDHNDEPHTNKENTNLTPIPTVVEPPIARTSSQSSYVNVDMAGNRSLVQPHTPASPLPARLSFSRADSPGSPVPPLPARNYSESGSELSGTERLGSVSSNEDKPVIEHTTSSQGNEYAVINRGPKQGAIREADDSPPPPVPLRAKQRLAQDAMEAGYSEIATHSTRRSGGYTEIDIPKTNSENLPTDRPLAYAVVELSREDKPMISEQPRKQTMSGRPRPYEVASSSFEDLAEPGYEQVNEATTQLSTGGYIEVKKERAQRTSSKELHVIPYSNGKDSDSPTARRGSPHAGRDSPLSQDSVFDSEVRYDLPFNSARLQKLNITLPRDSTPPAAPGYSRLDLSKEAILLRSGVTLRRYGQLESVSSIISRADDGSEDSAASDPDDRLEPVNRAIKSLETTLGVSADELSSSPVELVRAPEGPPSWTKAQKRPHTYERVTSAQGETNSQPSTLEMDWDESEFSTGKGPTSRVKELSKNISSSTPNLLRDTNVAVPHLVRPPRVSEEAFQLRKHRLLNHDYEDVEKEQSVGDVNALNSSVRESWGEGSQGSDSELPKGWQSMKDEFKKTYYWHVPSGRTQYDRPTSGEVRRLSLSVDEKHSVQLVPTRNKRRPAPTFRANYLASLDVEESELIQGQCVKVVHGCINSVTSNPEATAKETSVFLQVHEASLRWLDPDTSSPTVTQPINKIRVWGIGLENERDFGYVARDVNTKKHKCHVFRCERPARAVARALLEAHQKERMEKKAKKALRKEESPDNNTENTGATSSDQAASQITSPENSEYERISCTYLGSCEVFQKEGIDVVNDAMEKLCSRNNSRYSQVNVDIATSHIRISEANSKEVIAEHRVRFLCFLGIAKDDKYCGYILDNGTINNIKQLKFHGFRKEPNTDHFCLALHKACQARFARVMASNPQAKKEKQRIVSEEPSTPTKSKSTSNLFGRLGSLRKSKSKPLLEESLKHETFLVQYLGCQGVSKAEGLDAVRVPLQQLAQPVSSTHTLPPFLVDFDVSPAGITMTDTLKSVVNKKSFPVKNITYVVRVRNYFAFIVRDSGKLNCHVFIENEIDAGTIVSTVEKLLTPESSSPTK